MRSRRKSLTKLIVDNFVGLENQHYLLIHNISYGEGASVNYCKPIAHTKYTKTLKNWSQSGPRSVKVKKYSEWH